MARGDERREEAAHERIFLTVEAALSLLNPSKQLWLIIYFTWWLEHINSDSCFGPFCNNTVIDGTRG